MPRSDRLSWHDLVNLELLQEGLFEIVVYKRALYRGGIGELAIDDGQLIITPTWLMHRPYVSNESWQKNSRVKEPKILQCHVRPIAVNVASTSPQRVSAWYFAIDRHDVYGVSLFAPQARPFEIKPKNSENCTEACASSQLVIH